MPPSTGLFRASAPLFRARAGMAASQTSRNAFTRSTFRPNPFRNGRNGSRFQSTAAGAENPSWFKRMWESPVGLKTVHFWAPVMKWALVLAGISDFARPAEKLSFTQNFALTATGLIWTRWCLIIKPKNILLAAVNFFLGIVGVVQISRIAMYHKSLKDGTAVEAEESKEVKEAVKEAVKS